MTGPSASLRCPADSNPIWFRNFVNQTITNYLTLNEISVKVKRNEKVEIRQLAKI